MGAHMPVADGVARIGCAYGLDKPLVVEGHQRVILLEDDLGNPACGGNVPDQGGKARCSGVPIGRVSPSASYTVTSIPPLAISAETMARRRGGCSCFMWMRRCPGRTQAA